MQAKFIEYKKDINQYYSNNKIFNSKDYNMFTKIKDCNYLSRVLAKLIKNWKTAFSFFKKNMSEILNNGDEVFAEYCLKIILNAKREYIDKVTRLLKKAKIEPNFIAKIFRGAYDNSFAYRLCYNLRNYVQHVDIVGIYLLKDYDGKISFKIDLSKYRDNHDGIQPSFKKELEVIESDTYNLNSLLDDLNEQILQIHTKIVDTVKLVLLENKTIYCLSLKFLYNKYADKNIRFNAIIDSWKENHRNKSKIHLFDINEITKHIDFYCKQNIKVYSDDKYKFIILKDLLSGNLTKVKELTREEEQVVINAITSFLSLIIE